MSSAYRYLQRLAHEKPVYFWSLAIGFAGPVMVYVVPRVRKANGFKPVEQVPTTFPLPDRARRPTVGFEDA